MGNRQERRERQVGCVDASLDVTVKVGVLVNSATTMNLASLAILAVVRFKSTARFNSRIARCRRAFREAAGRVASRCDADHNPERPECPGCNGETTC